MTPLKTPVSSKGLFDHLYQSYIPQIVNTAIEIELFEILSKGAEPLHTLCQRLKTHEAVTQALIDVLIAMNLIQEKAQAYMLTRVAEDFLVKGSQANQIHAVKEFNGGSGPFANLPDALRNGPAPFNQSMWSSKESVLNMEQGQKGGPIQSVLAFARDLPQFDTCTNMCDFAGNIGYFSLAFMAANKNLRAHVYDLPQVCALARELKQDQDHFDRICFHDFDMEKDSSFGSGYDLFLSSHFLYEMNAKNRLKDFLTRVNQAMVPGGVFISNHVVSSKDGRLGLTSALLELMTRCMGYPTHHLPEHDLKTALTHAGFGDFTTMRLETQFIYPILLLSAVKTAGQDSEH